MELAPLRSDVHFAKLSESELSAFEPLPLPCGREANLQALVWAQLVDHLQLSHEGTVPIPRMVLGKEMLMGRLGPGSFCGAVNLFDPAAASASIWSMKTTRMTVVDYDTRNDFMRTCPGIGFQTVPIPVAELPKRLRKTNDRLASVVHWLDDLQPPRR
jgi:hypothetical protein